MNAVYDSSVGKESTCNAEDPGSIPGSGRSAGEGIGYALQYSWASLVAQLVKNLAAKRETWVQSLGWVGKILRRRDRVPSPVFWPGEFHGLYSPWGHRVTHDSAVFPFTCDGSTPSHQKRDPFQGPRKLFFFFFNLNLLFCIGVQLISSPLVAQSVKSLPATQAGINPQVRKIPGEGNGNPLQYSLPGKFHGQRSLVGYSLQDQKVGHE